MSAFLLADIDVHDFDAYVASGYREAAEETAARYGGVYIARGGATEVLEGEYEPRRTVIIQFPSMENLREWYHSDEYAPWIAVRQSLTHSRLVAIDGLAG
jgi:uncharacterized protein (DUF1330 family)